VVGAKPSVLVPLAVNGEPVPMEAVPKLVTEETRERVLVCVWVEVEV
jgi:hypothetical protein